MHLRRKQLGEDYEQESKPVHDAGDPVGPVMTVIYAGHGWREKEASRGGHCCRLVPLWAWRARASPAHRGGACDCFPRVSLFVRALWCATLSSRSGVFSVSSTRGLSSSPSALCLRVYLTHPAPWRRLVGSRETRPFPFLRAYHLSGNRLRAAQRICTGSTNARTGQRRRRVVAPLPLRRRRCYSARFCASKKKREPSCAARLCSEWVCGIRVLCARACSQI